jgi:ferritin-like protein
MSSVDRERLEEKIGEAIGLELAAQKAVKELTLKGLLPGHRLIKNKMEGMRKEANNHQTEMEDLVKKLSDSDGLDAVKIQEIAQENEQKASKIMETYLGEVPDSQEALEFLCLAEGAEVTHYEVLSAMTKGIKNKRFPAKIRSILNQEKKHLLLCTQLAKKNAST